MSFFNRQGRALLLAAVVAVGAVCVSCGTAGRASSRKDKGAKDGQADSLANIEEKQSGKVGAGTFTDSRDGKTYKWVVIGEQTWMAENLNFATSSGSWCYEDDNSNCEKYGRLYDWKAATTACPSGWHLPSEEEWDDLMRAVGSESKWIDDGYGGGYDYWDDAGKKLKSTSGWTKKDNGSSGNGTDKYGFSALPGGRRCSDGNFGLAGNYGNWWSAAEDSDGYAYYRSMDYYHVYLDEYGYDEDYGFSVRCVGD